MSKLFTVNDAGVVVATLAGAKERFDELNKEVFGADINLHTQTPQNQIAGINAQIWAEVGEQVRRASIYGASINHAPGKFLDAFGSLFGIKRRIATRTRVECVLTGVDGTVVPVGSIVQNTQGDQFRSESNVRIENGQASVTFVAIDPGAIPAEAGEVNVIVTVTDPRWRTVTNPMAGIVGLNEESDTEYRANLKRLTGLASRSTISAIHSAIMQANADKIVVLENSTDATATRQGVSLPARSLLVVAAGGLISDLSRAYETYRPVGVSTRAIVAASKSWVASDTSNINAGTFRYNGQTFTGIDMRTDSTITNAIATLNGISNGPDFISSDNIPMLSYTWSPDLDGFEPVSGTANESTIDEGVKLERVYATPGNDAVVFKFNTTINFLSAACTITRSGSDPAPSVTFTTPYYLGEMVILSANTSMPSDLDSITFSSVAARTPNIVNVGSNHVNHTFTNVVGDIVQDRQSQSLPPDNTLVSGEPGDASIEIRGVANGSVSKWQYIRYDGIDYIDKDTNGNREWQDFPASSILTATLSGFTNGREGSRVYLRPYHNTFGAGEEATITFEASDTAPVVESAVADGKQIALAFSTPLTPRSTTTSGGWSVTAGGSNRHINRIITDRNVMYLALNVAATVGQAITVSYDASASNVACRITSKHGTNASDFSLSAANVDNQTLSGVPARPMQYRSFYTGDGIVKSIWNENSNGGQTIDAYEYSLTYDNGSTWTDWATLASDAREISVAPNTISQLPNRIRVRASNPNAHILQKLGFTGLNVLTPITRPVVHSLSISITLDNASELVRDALAEIKAAIVNRVKQYDMGETIWSNDLLAVAELVQGAKITNISVTHNSADVNDVSQPAYVQWVLTENNITFA